MAKKCFCIFLAIIIFSLCCGFSFAQEENSSVTLGNEIMDSIDKTTRNAENVVNMDGEKTNNGESNIKNDITKGMDSITGGEEEAKNVVDSRVNETGSGTYNTVRTTAEGTNSSLDTMTTTTWMWIILIAAAVVIIAAIWYYATQDNH